MPTLQQVSISRLSASVPLPVVWPLSSLFFSGMPVDTPPGMAFVIIQHLAPDHRSILTELIKRFTRMDVFEVTDRMKIEPDSVYIIPPNKDMALSGDILQLFEPAAPRGHRLPIDFFFTTLAQNQRNRAICIILSGTGSDGIQGMRAVKAEGGMVMAQAPESRQLRRYASQCH